MTTLDDPFRHHPGLRQLITPPEASQFRDMTAAKLRAMIVKHGGPVEWLHSDAELAACRAETMSGRLQSDLWVFAYGSLMWDPAVCFSEVRRGFAAGVARAFILRDDAGGRGTKERPGVMAALDHGDGCHGLVFRIDAAQVDPETKRLWGRERIGRAYHPAFIPVETDLGTVEALTFMADYDAEIIAPDLSHEEQVEFCATGAGFLGTSFDYVANLAEHFRELRIEDPVVTRLLTDARTFRAANPEMSPV